MEKHRTPPLYKSPSRPASGLALLRRTFSDPASVIPESVYEDWALKLPGPGMPIVVTHPESVREVLLDDGGTFGRNAHLRRMMHRGWGNGLAGAEGESWAAQRHAASPAFRPKAIETALPKIAGIARQGVARWRPGESVELRTAFARIVSEIVLETLLTRPEGVDLDQVAQDIPTVTREVTTFGLLDAAPLPDPVIRRLRRFGRTPEEARLRSLASTLAGAAPASGHNVLALLRDVGPLADNALGFMLAGLDTTAVGAAWAAYLLSLYPDWQDAVRAEAEDSRHQDQSGNRLPLTERVVKEALRLYPPAPILVRSAVKRTTLQGLRIRPNQAILIPVYAIHRHRRLWDRPDSFDPDRFAPGGHYKRSAYLPFGAGPRLCIAAAFATAEIAAILSALVSVFRISPAGPAPDVSHAVTTHSRTGLNVLLAPV